MRNSLDIFSGAFWMTGAGIASPKRSLSTMSRGHWLFGLTPEKLLAALLL
jgi:hypothetical protein